MSRTRDAVRSYGKVVMKAMFDECPEKCDALANAMMPHADQMGHLIAMAIRDGICLALLRYSSHMDSAPHLERLVKAGLVRKGASGYATVTEDGLLVLVTSPTVLTTGTSEKGGS